MTGTETTASKVRNCSCNTRPSGKEGQCDAQTKKSFAQGHDARMSSRVATAIATKQVTMEQGLEEIRKAGGGPALISKTQWSVALRAKKLAAKSGSKNGGRGTKCAECGKRSVDKSTQGKDSTMCTQCFEYAGWENTHNDDGHETNMNADCPICAELLNNEPEADDEPATVTIKLGRWTYPATLDAKGDATYTNRRGEQMSATAGTFSVQK